MTYPGTDLKFRVTTTIEGFHPADDDFTVTVRNRL